MSDHRCPLCDGPIDQSQTLAQVRRARALAAEMSDTARLLEQAALLLSQRVSPSTAVLHGKDIDVAVIEVMLLYFGTGNPIHYRRIHKAMVQAGKVINGVDGGLPTLLTRLGRHPVMKRAGRGQYMLEPAA